MVLIIFCTATAEALYCSCIIRNNKFEIWILENISQCRITSLLTRRHQKVMSLWWDICSWGVVSLISQSSSYRRHSCLKRSQQQETPWTGVTSSHLSPITDSRFQTLGVQWDGAVKWEGLVTLSGDVWGSSQVDGEPQGAIRERGKKLEARMKGGARGRMMKPGDVPRPRTQLIHFTYITKTHTLTWEHSGQCVNTNLSMCCVQWSLSREA